MIRFTVKCPEGHAFESWFKSSEAFDSLSRADMVTCPECGAPAREKALMAPRVTTARKAASAPETEQSEATPDNTHALAAPSSKAEEALRALRKQVQENSEYVGDKFANEARAIHLGDAPERSIYGETSADEARKLVEDGVPVAPLPFVPTRKSN